MCNTEKLVVITAKNGKSNIYSDDDGMLSLLKDYASCDGIGGPVFLYKLGDKCKDYLDEYPPFIYEVVNKYGDVFFTPDVWSDVVVKNKYQILKTNDTRFADSFLYELEELKDDIELYNLQKRDENYDDDLEDEDIFEDEDTSDGFLDDEEIDELLDAHEKSCDLIAMVFCEKHGYDHDDMERSEKGCYRMGNIRANIIDMCFDLKNDIQPDIFEEWQWYNTERFMRGKSTYNYETYCAEVNSGEIELFEEDDIEENETDDDDDIEYDDRYLVQYCWVYEDGDLVYDSKIYHGEMNIEAIENFIDPEEEMEDLQIINIKKM